MDEKEIRRLWAEQASGIELSADDQRRLVEALEARDELREELLRDAETDGWLRTLGRPADEAETFTETLLESLDREEDATRFANAVERRLEPPTTRRKRVHRRATAPDRTPFIWGTALAAAALLVAFILLPARNGPPPVRKATPESPSALTPAPEVKKPAAATPVEQPPRIPDVRPPKPGPRNVPSAPRIESTPDLPVPRKPRPEAPVPKAVPRPETKVTRVAVATLSEVRGDVRITLASETRRAARGETLLEGSALELGGAESRATLLYEDGTTVVLDSGTRAEEFALKDGKTLRLEKGTLRADVKKQPVGRPMVVRTPGAEATVLGTTLRIVVAPESGSTRLDVTEGRVRLKRTRDGRSVVVASGHFAVAGEGSPLRSQLYVPDTLAADLLMTRDMLGINFGPAGTPSAEGYLVDSGDLFDMKRGFGWKEPIKQVHDKLDMGRPLMTRSAKRKANSAGVKASTLGVGWMDITQTWVMPIPNGRYLVTVGAGDTYPQGPHHVRVEDVQILNNIVTGTAGRNDFYENTAVVTVRDGELTVVVGGGGKDLDGTSDSILTHMILRRISK